MYGEGDSRRRLELDGVSTKVDYPPLSLYELIPVGRWGRAHVSVAIKATTAIAEAALVALLWWTSRGHAASRGAMAGVALWLNPASLMIGSVLGYLDPLFALPAVGAVIAAASMRSALAGALVAAACLTKPLAIFTIPAVIVGLGQGSDLIAMRRRVLTALAAASAVTAIVLVPIAVDGGLRGFALAMGSLLRDPFLSANGVSIWAPVDAIGVRVPLDAARAAGAVLTIVTIAWSAAAVRSARDRWLLAALAAFAVHAYTTLAVAVHENHLYLAVPLLALASAGRPRFTGPFAAVSAIVAVNLYLAYGFGVDVGFGPPGRIAGVDPLVWLAPINAGAFVWFARVLRDEAAVTA